ncbi:MAG TPA: protein-L-isoaspartate O-methyltransferase, partial [Methylophilaceae bacterium]|nr:protein-L-isoaspartate O-methyltransferase [Methylophilaceae bacterium]
IPVGTETQYLHLIEHIKTPTGSEYRQTKLEAVKFVPLLGGTS